MLRLCCIPGLLVLLCATLPVSAQVKYPAPEQSLDVQLRYRIRVARNERIVLFRELSEYLDKLGFQHTDKKAFDLDLLDPAAELVTGTLATDQVSHLFKNESVITALVAPTGTSFDKEDKIAEVRLHIATGYLPEQQQLLHQQVVAQLARLGFEQASSYDHRGNTVVRGRLPAIVVPTLLKDLRALPAGWFVGSGDRSSQPLPLRGVVPVRLIEVLPDLPAVVPPDLSASEKLSQELTLALQAPDAAEQPLVVEVILEGDVSDRAIETRRLVSSALPGMAIEGVAGKVVTLRLPKASYIDNLVAYEQVRSIRLPRVGQGTVHVANQPSSPSNYLQSSNTTILHELGYRGAGSKVVIIAPAFTGVRTKADQLILNDLALPAGSQFIDLTTELSTKIEPSANNPLHSSGTATALAAHQAAPEASLLLVRVDPGRIHQVLDVARAVCGEAITTPALFTRNEELSVRTTALDTKRKIVNDEVSKAFADLSDEEKPAQRRAAASAALKSLKAEEAEHLETLRRYLALREQFTALIGSNVVISTIVWNQGYAHDGLSELAELIETKFAVGARLTALRSQSNTKAPTWVQASSEAVGSVWSGPFLDADKNGIMEFGSTANLPKGQWTPELNALGYTTEGKPSLKLPEGLKIRLSVQWREPHQRDLVLPYEPLFQLRLRLFQQLDPDGKAVASDELVEVARSVAEPIRLYVHPGSGVYEQSMDVTIPQEGVYFLRLDGFQNQSGILSGSQVEAEITPRVMVQIVDEAQAAKGQAVFQSYSTVRSGVGIPADARSAVSAGVADAGKTLTGAGPGIALRQKPDLLAPGQITSNGTTWVGSGVAAGYIGGTIACLQTAEIHGTDLLKTIGLKAGEALVLPAEWLQTFSPRATKSKFDR